MSLSTLQDTSILHLDWKYTASELFAPFSQQAWSMLLTSADTNHSDSRYDIICVAPVASLVTQDDTTSICYYDNHDNKPVCTDLRQSQVNPFDLISQEINRFFPVSKASSLPFSGGAMGSFSYDLARLVEKLPTLAEKDIDLPQMNIGIYTWALVFDRQLRIWSLVHYGSKDEAKSALAWVESVLSATEPSTAESFELTSTWQAQITKSQYIEKFDRIQSYLNSGDCYQINLTQRFSASYNGDEWHAFLKLSKENKAPYSAFIRLPEAALISISPERFIQLKGQDIQTKPIKGTKPRFSDAGLDLASAEQLLNSEKDRAENLMIVDLLRNDLGKVAKPGSVKVPHLFKVESFPAVHHLVSTVTAKLDSQYHATDLLKASFPGGSITGAPKIRAMEIIEELEPSRRSLYCGSIGYISQDGQMDTSITIRTLVATEGEIHCWAGGGIVADSQADDEYQESYDKVSKILPVLEG